MVTVLFNDEVGAVALGKVNGIVQKGNGKGFKFTQSKGKKVRFHILLNEFMFL